MEVGHGRTSRMAVRGTEKVESVLAVVEVEGRLCLLEEAGVASLHVMKVVERTGARAVAGLGLEAGDQSGLEEVEGLEQIGQSLAQEAEALVCQVEVVEVQNL